MQSEIEGDDNEKVGFYGRCMLHAAQDAIDADCHPGVNTEVGSPKKDWSCARTEVLHNISCAALLNFLLEAI